MKYKGKGKWFWCLLWVFPLWLGCAASSQGEYSDVSENPGLKPSQFSNEATDDKQVETQPSDTPKETTEPLSEETESNDKQDPDRATPTFAKKNKDNGFVAMDVFYGTTRHYTGKKSSPKFYGHVESDHLEYGIATVTVPTDPKMRAKGSLTTPLQVFEIKFQKEDPKKHVILQKVGILKEDEFFSQLNGHLDTSESMLVFVHGFNNTFEYVAQRTGQLAYDLEFKGAPVFFSWPSNGQAEDYIKDANRIRAAVIDLRIFLKSLHSRTQAKSIYLVAHSMGSVGLTNALYDLSLEMRGQSKPLFTEVILAAPDIDEKEFAKLFKVFQKVTQRTTLYASSKDQALIISREVNGYSRLGDSRDGIVILPGLDSIDVSRLDTSLIGHSYFGDNQSVIADLYKLIRGKPVSQRSQLVKRLLKGLSFWEFVPPGN